MKFLKSYTLYERVSKETKLFESGRLVTFAMANRMRKIKSNITDILRDNVLDKEIPLEIHVRNYTDEYRYRSNPVEVIKIQIGDELLDIDNFIRVDEIKDDIYAITSYLEDEGFEYNTFSYDDDGYIKGNMGDVMKTVGLETTYLSLFYKKEIKDPYLEKIEVPIEVGDTVLGGRFKNKKIVVKKIGKNKKGDITINDKPLLKFRLVKESLQQDVDHYFRHLEDDNFAIQVEDDYFRIFKPIKQLTNWSDRIRSTYLPSYSNCNTLQWSEIAGEVARYVDELNDKSVDYAYVVKRTIDEYGDIYDREQIHDHLLLDETFDCGEILIFVIGFK